MYNSLRSFCLPALLVVLSATRVAAQEEVTALPGERLQFDVVGPSTPPLRARCSGRIVSAALDTLIVASSGECKRGSYLADLRVVRGDRGSRATHVTLGAFAGGALGALVARLTGVQCGGQPCVGGERGRVSTSKLFTMAGVGALAGGSVGFVWPAGPVWVRAGASRPVRVGGYEERSSIEISIGHSFGG